MSTKHYTAQDVAKHNKESDLWIIYNGEVYDVTKFVDEHPGGEEVVIDVAGTDATEAFDDIGHSEEAHEVMGPYKIGTLEGGVVKEVKTAQSQVVEDKDSSSGFIVGVFIVIAAVIGYYAKQQGYF